ncbi:FtsK/SpoIIIE domain-containing protein [Actinomadura geliboluensis]|uniref:FtsK/SpoIIIE domain-containing protein n=1 Tax=Actinomadura geliboluensis TaxID=882440 RepID=UPI00260EEA0F|nr:FtsK/SpoIIIE domain-containing protein [Actinomadura geliboluensis]
MSRSQRFAGVAARGRVGLPPLLQRPELPVRARLTVGSALLLWVVRPSWLWRRELLAVVVLAVVAAAGWWARGWVGAVAAPAEVVLIVVVVPWSRRRAAWVWRRARLRRQWDRACRFAGLTTVNDRIPRIRADRRVPAGDRLLVRMPRGATVDDLAGEAERVAAVLKVREVRVGRDLGWANLAHVDVVRRDPFAGAGPLRWPWVEAARRSLADAVPLCVDDMGEPVAVRLPGKHFLIGGEPESGKSAALSLLLAAAALDPTAQIWGWDAKIVELALWRPVMTRFADHDMGAAVGQLEDLVAEMDRRYEVLEAAGRRELRPGEAPLILAAIDELRFYTANTDSKAAKHFNALGEDIAARGRAALIVQVAATQKPAGAVVPTGWRDLMALRWAMRSTTRDASDTILGAGMATAGFDASEIDIATRGVGLLYAEGGFPRRVRSYYLTDHDIRSIVARGAALRA